MRQLTIVSLVFLAVLSRVIPHPPNFAPITAIALFCAANYKNPMLLYGVPVLSMFLGDLLLSFLISHGMVVSWMGDAAASGFYPASILGYTLLVGTTTLGFFFMKDSHPQRILTTTLMASVFFFVLSNFLQKVWEKGRSFSSECG